MDVIAPNGSMTKIASTKTPTEEHILHRVVVDENNHPVRFVTKQDLDKVVEDLSTALATIELPKIPAPEVHVAPAEAPVVNVELELVEQQLVTIARTAEALHDLAQSQKFPTKMQVSGKVNADVDLQPVIKSIESIKFPELPNVEFPSQIEVNNFPSPTDYTNNFLAIAKLLREIKANTDRAKGEPKTGSTFKIVNKSVKNFCTESDRKKLSYLTLENQTENTQNVKIVTDDKTIVCFLSLYPGQFITMNLNSVYFNNLTVDSEHIVQVLVSYEYC